MTLDTILPFLKPLRPFLDDPHVTDVMVNGDGPAYIEENGVLQGTNVRISAEHMDRLCKNIAHMLGKEIDEHVPMLDGRTPNGWRISVVYPPIAVDGTALCIRKFNGWKSRDELIEIGSIKDYQVVQLECALEGRQNVLVSGATGTGKTTLLRALSKAIAPRERIVTIEDTAELNIEHANILRMESRPPEITERELVAKALRMRPDRLILGEVRNGAAWDLVQALNTGHGGSMSTIHANSAVDALYRLTDLMSEAGMKITETSLRIRVARAIQYVVHVSKVAGKRCVTEIIRVKPWLQDGEFVTEAA